MERVDGDEGIAAIVMGGGMGRVGFTGDGFTARDGRYAVDDYAAGSPGRSVTSQLDVIIRGMTRRLIVLMTRCNRSVDTTRYCFEGCG